MSSINVCYQVYQGRIFLLEPDICNIDERTVTKLTDNNICNSATIVLPKCTAVLYNGSSVSTKCYYCNDLDLNCHFHDTHLFSLLPYVSILPPFPLTTCHMHSYHYSTMGRSRKRPWPPQLKVWRHYFSK